MLDTCGYNRFSAGLMSTRYLNTLAAASWRLKENSTQQNEINTECFGMQKCKELIYFSTCVLDD